MCFMEDMTFIVLIVIRDDCSCSKLFAVTSVMWVIHINILLFQSLVDLLKKFIFYLLVFVSFASVMKELVRVILVV